MNREVAHRTLGFLLRRPFDLIKTLTLTTSSSPLSSSPSSPSASDTPQNPNLRKKKKNLFDVVKFLPDWGIGYKVAKTHWRDVSYQITKINLYKDGRHGKAWGIRFKAGLQAADDPIRISGVNKRGWKYIKESQKKKDSPSKAEEVSLA
ncbi:uncharacterized protein LOC109720718 [Ananas comosus]|uniref:Uncharacterized protein LOC109720718 n=1 Tax=Ananas comosus TaxID=4615 RepID=A0A6P5GCF6_ANACO|nr:uncharacterized protein LOC109720718 [Ananas comosus]